MRRLMVLCAAVALALTGCTEGQPEVHSGDQDGATEAATRSPEPADRTGPTVEVLDAGEEPRYPMRLDPDVGQEILLEMSMRLMVTDLTIDGEPQFTSSNPSVIQVIHGQVDDVTPDTIQSTLTIRDVFLLGDPDPQDMLDTLKGVSGTVTTTRSGAFVEGGFSLAGVDPELQEMMQSFDQQLSSFSIPMPEEDVGAGAHWRVALEYEAGGVVTHTSAEYYLVGFDGVEYELAFQLEQTMVPAVLADGAQLREGSGRGTGTVTGRLDFPFAVEGRSAAEITMVLEFDHGDWRVMEQTLGVSSSVKPAS